MTYGAFGKGFERYYERAKGMEGVRFEWAKPAVVGEDPETHAVTLRYRLDGARVYEEAFDLVVLSVGLTSPASNRLLAEKMGITVTEDGFCQSSALHPMETERPGIYACGVFYRTHGYPRFRDHGRRGGGFGRGPGGRGPGEPSYRKNLTPPSGIPGANPRGWGSSSVTAAPTSSRAWMCPMWWHTQRHWRVWSMLRRIRSVVPSIPSSEWFRPSRKKI